jgi:hypothetical protein
MCRESLEIRLVNNEFLILNLVAVSAGESLLYRLRKAVAVIN